jgi:hypothetical protein
MNYYRKHFDEIKGFYEFMILLLPWPQRGGLIWCIDLERKEYLWNKAEFRFCCGIESTYVSSICSLLSLYWKYDFIAPTPSAVCMPLFSSSVNLGGKRRTNIKDQTEITCNMLVIISFFLRAHCLSILYSFFWGVGCRTLLWSFKISHLGTVSGFWFWW